MSKDDPVKADGGYTVVHACTTQASAELSGAGYSGQASGQGEATYYSKALQRELLELAHEGHQGHDKTQQRLRQSV